ncbi:dTDP-4-dehydrorhamnose reductase [Roseibium sp. RKSG952]|uniref:dTDP-4-dehydrorhamnose reductase n=1 Tax=Roseibium sp. RKSG952 TaxID=2529384 RepID=UPI0012BCA5F2|nr:dTDP-4-dehydrorhamnose reductase [Roseibium sp. RKSG952]MTI02894.1 dTDP-4-dehydrorhamnose reductase [Roseibium sp. RKSG952]
MAAPLLVFGKTGQVAHELTSLAPDAVFLPRSAVDLSDPEACEAAIRQHTPRAVINAAAYTAVDKAEEEDALAHVINGEAPVAMARAAAALGCPLVHISTDYVFDGQGETPWSPIDPVNPQNAYGRSKLAGEKGIAASGATYAILRTSWVFSGHGNNFLKTMLRLSETRDALSIVDDQIGGPTPARAIAQACLAIAEQLCEDSGKSGIYHFSGAPDVSWKDFASEIFSIAGRTVDVTGIPTADYPTPATRPMNSRMDCSTTEAVFGVPRPDWRDATQTIVGQLRQKGEIS